MDVFAKNKSPNIDPWWTKWGVEMAHLAARWGLALNAKRRIMSNGTPGEWVISGPPAAVKAFEDMAEMAGQHIGCKGTRAICIQFWLDHMQGDHIQRRPAPVRKDDERVQIYTKGDGTKEAYRGRQRIG